MRDVIDEIEMRARGTDAEDIARARHDLPALEELGLSLESAPRDAALARIEALQRDDRTLRRRFERWFPVPRVPSSKSTDEKSREASTSEREIWTSW